MNCCGNSHTDRDRGVYNVYNTRTLHAALIMCTQPLGFIFDEYLTLIPLSVNSAVSVLTYENFGKCALCSLIKKRDKSIQNNKINTTANLLNTGLGNISFQTSLAV